MLEDAAAEEFADLEQTDPNCVVVGLAPSSFHYAKLDEAFKLGKPLLRPKTIMYNLGLFSH